MASRIVHLSFAQVWLTQWMHETARTYRVLHCIRVSVHRCTDIPGCSRSRDGSVAQAASGYKRVRVAQPRVCGQTSNVQSLLVDVCSPFSSCLIPLLSLLRCQSVHGDAGGCSGSRSSPARVVEGVALRLSAAERRSVRESLNDSRSETASGVALIAGDWVSGGPGDVLTTSEWMDRCQGDSQLLAGQFGYMQDHNAVAILSVHVCPTDNS